MELEFDIISSNKIIYATYIWYKNKKIKLRCSYRLTLLSLRNLAIIANIKEKEIFPYNILNSNIEKIMVLKEEDFNNLEEYDEFTKKNGKIINVYEKIIEYCENDVIITKTAIKLFINILTKNYKINLNKNNILSAAKLSITCFFKKKRLIKKKIKIKYDRLIRPYYFGGRTEVFGNPRENEIMLHFDWSGMYAQCLKEKVMGGEIYTSEIVNEINIHGFYWIKFKQKMDIPILPIKRDKLYFANGTFEGWYWFEEIILAKEMGVEILEIKKVITSQIYDNLIEDFIEENDNIREKKGVYKIIGKNNNNTLYGRLGMNPLKKNEKILKEKKEGKNYIEINGFYLTWEEKEKNIGNITIAASITAKARIKLYKGIMEVKKKGGRILYTDTDSIIAAFNKENYKEALNKQIGEIYFDDKKSDTIINDAVFAMPKTYAIKTKDKEIVKIKGFNIKPNFETFKKKFYEKKEIESINKIWNKKNLEIKIENIKKKTNLYGLDKRKWHKDMKDTNPIEF